MNTFSHSLLRYIVNHTLAEIDEMTQNLLMEFEQALLHQAPILHYPSAGGDMRDVLYFNRSRLQELPADPEIYIHTDFYIDGRYFTDFLNSGLYRYSRNRQISTLLPLSVAEEATFQLAKLDLEDRSPVFVAYFSAIRNEDLLKVFLDHRIRVPYRYCVCDGITSGMFGVDNSISTLCYLFLEELGTSYIITEYGRSELAYRDQRDPAFYERQRKALLNFTGQLRSSALRKSIDDRVTAIPFKAILDQFKEYPVNTADSPRFLASQSTDPGYLKMLVKNRSYKLSNTIV